MKKKFFILREFNIWRLLSILLLISCSYTPGFAEDAPHKVSIPLPDGMTLDFRAIYLGLDGNQLFASRPIKLGARKSNPSYKERLVETLISGAFVGKRNGQKDWLYYMAETEMKIHHWNAIMRWADEQEGREPRDKNDSNYPQTGITLAEIQYFIEKLNSWMLTRQRSYLPKYRNAIAFARLPLESEWAFAARGGIKTLDHNPDRFDRPYPYEGDLGKFEWHRDNSGKEVQECGSAYVERNPVGLYDMLGNVQELTISLFGPEYQQGRFGQTLVRGGNFSSAPKDLSASLRMEYAPYNPDGSIRRPAKTGFRLVLSTAISASGSTPEVLDNEFEKYTQTHALTRPGLVGETSPASQSEQDLLQSLRKQVVRLEIGKKNLMASLRKQVVRLETDKKNLMVSHQKQVTGLAADNKRLTQKIEENRGRNYPIPRGSVTKNSDEQLKKQALLFVKEKGHLKTQVSVLSKQLEDRQQEVEKKHQKIKDLQRQITAFKDSEFKNTRRVRVVEKRFLNALMSKASANAGLAYRQLKRMQILSDKMQEIQKQRLQKEATDMLDDYWKLIILMAEKTEKSLFPEVKKELSEWFRLEHEGGLKFQRKSLDLIQRHVFQVRKGRSRRPEDFVKEFNDYWLLIKEMAMKTDENLFPEEKKELSGGLRQQELKGGAVFQRKSLDLIQRHVSQVRKGRYKKPTNFYKEFINQPEFQ